MLDLAPPLPVPAFDLTVRLINATVQIDQPRGEGLRTVGTGFLVQAPRPDGTPRVVLVTAAHVLERMSFPEARVGWREAGTDGSWRFTPRPLPIRDDIYPLWVRHPERDVAVIEVEVPPAFAQSAIPLAWLADAETFETYDVGPGDEMMALGFPRGLSSNRAGFPILRSGRIASYPLSPVSAFPTFLIDFTIFPGNSGGPVFMTEDARRGDGTEETDRPFVAGVITQVVELNDERLEIGIVTHAVFVRETIALLDQAPVTGASEIPPED